MFSWSLVNECCATFMARLLLACPCLPGVLLSHNPLLSSISPLSRPQTGEGAGALRLPSKHGSQRALNLPMAEARGFRTGHATPSWLVPSPASLALMAAFTSRSCRVPHPEQHQCLTVSCAKPLGPVKALQAEHILVEFVKSGSSYSRPLAMLLYESI